MTFEDFVRSHGLRPRVIAADGRWRRCPTESHPHRRNGAYKLAPDGRIGWVQDWATMPEPVTWRPDRHDDAPAYDPTELRRQWQEARAKAREAVHAARAFYAGCDPLIGGHPYLTDHMLDMKGCHGLRVDGDGWMVIPAYRGRSIVSVQRIAPDGTKRFWSGAPMKGASYTIERRAAVITILAEGLATGLALYAAVPNSRVVVAFTAGNMKEVAAEIPAGMSVVAADNDHGTEARIGENPGVIAAREAADVLGCGVAVPEGMDGTDWCDLRAELVRSRIDETPGARESDVRREVDARIARDVMRHVRFTASAKAS